MIWRGDGDDDDEEGNLIGWLAGYRNTENACTSGWCDVSVDEWMHE